MPVAIRCFMGLGGTFSGMRPFPVNRLTTHRRHMALEMLLSVTYQNFGTEGWEPITLDFNDAADILYDFHLSDNKYSNEELSETSPEDASSGTSFKSESEISYDMEQAEATKESPGLESNCQLYQQPATPPASPITSTLDVLSSDQEKMSRSIAALSVPSTTPYRHCCSCQSKVSASAQAKVV